MGGFLVNYLNVILGQEEMIVICETLFGGIEMSNDILKKNCMGNS
ncbi:MAG: hypothetical protein K0R92_2769 [Lachnospiraceae bacterium]|jgi:hypothetical protein|nr:hypothetical protein [Lachnospiraceae bacterium]